jgi:leucyl aminopeptidase
MNLYKSTRLNPNENLILIGLKNSDFSKYLTSDIEKNYVNDQINASKTQIFVNQFKRLVFIQIIEKKEQWKEYQEKESLRKAAVKTAQSLNEQKKSSVTLVHIDGTCEHTLAYAEGLALSNYQFIKYFTDREKKVNSLNDISIYCDKVSEKDITELHNLVQAVYYTRDLINEPLSYLTAEQLSREIEKMAKEAGFKVEVLQKKQIESLKMGGLLAVNKGSIDPPTFNILEHKPANAVNKKPYVLVGKGVVFDTGGLSLKPTPDSMDYMKCDMAGAAAVAGAFYVIAKNNLPVHVIGLIPATDNRPDGNAYAPGDVITMYNGTTVEVLNTDAEGRMILADALAWSNQYKPELVIDLATLTGAAHAAIGTQGMVGMGNADPSVMTKLKESGNKVYERIAEFPFWEEYDEMMKSDIADLKNIGGKLAGAITAGKFLEHFTDSPYIHLDIAGPSYLKKIDSYRGTGGTAVGVRLLYDFFKNL